MRSFYFIKYANNSLIPLCLFRGLKGDIFIVNHLCNFDESSTRNGTTGRNNTSFSGKISDYYKNNWQDQFMRDILDKRTITKINKQITLADSNFISWPSAPRV